MTTIKNYLKEIPYDPNQKQSNGLQINLDKNELLIKGDKVDLIELANYILNTALSEEKKDHIHLDELTLLDKNSKIHNLIIEKED